MTCIKIRNLTKCYKEKEILHNISMVINLDNHLITGLIGPNGTGKTTLMKTLSGILNFSGGMIQVENSKKRDYYKWAFTETAYIPVDDRNLFPKLTSYENVMYYSALKGEDLRDTKIRIDYFSNKLKVNKFLNKKVETLSTGQKKKVQLLMILCANKKFMILDEPSSGLDIDSIKELKILLVNLAKNTDKKFLISSHDVNLLSEVIDDYCFLIDGSIKKRVQGNMSISEIEKLYYSLRESETNGKKK